MEHDVVDLRRRLACGLHGRQAHASEIRNQLLCYQGAELLDGLDGVLGVAAWASSGMPGATGLWSILVFGINLDLCR